MATLTTYLPNYLHTHAAFPADTCTGRMSVDGSRSSLVQSTLLPAKDGNPKTSCYTEYIHTCFSSSDGCSLSIIITVAHGAATSTALAAILITYRAHYYSVLRTEYQGK